MPRGHAVNGFQPNQFDGRFTFVTEAIFNSGFRVQRGPEPEAARSKERIRTPAVELLMTALSGRHVGLAIFQTRNTVIRRDDVRLEGPSGNLRGPPLRD